MAQKIFAQMDINKNGIITLQEFQLCLTENPNLLEIYDVFQNEIYDSKEISLNKTADQKLLRVNNIIDGLILQLHQNSMNLIKICKNISQKNGLSLESVSMNGSQSPFNKDRKLIKNHQGFNPITSEKIDPIYFDDEEDNFGKNCFKSLGKKLNTDIKTKKEKKDSGPLLVPMMNLTQDTQDSFSKFQKHKSLNPSFDLRNIMSI